MVINRIRVYQDADPEVRPAWQRRRATVSLDLEEIFTNRTIHVRPQPPAPSVRRRPERSVAMGAGGRRNRPLRPSARRRNWVLALSIGVAVLIGALTGSGVFDDRARFNAERYAAESGEVELYVVPEVYGHPGARPLARSGSIREFLGMASAF